MKTVSDTTRRRIEAQGYLGLSDEMLCEVGPWLRFAPGICMVWVGVATYLGSVTALWVLMPFAALGALFRGHPFEVLYNHGIRHVIGTAHLPPANAPRRFACAVATSWIAATAWAFHSDAATLGAVLGWSLAVAAAVPTFTDFCIPSFFYGLMFGKPRAAGGEV
ncbi:MAG: DUF4395 domain-containing protein [Gemmatimonadota bacterium]|nr:DUF4395 domain-containing protein [Gemmatimonadota bacterium]MDH5760653.1 DUF4395 domain-containing protein [Gemmatimonadota bacterium]